MKLPVAARAMDLLGSCTTHFSGYRHLVVGFSCCSCCKHCGFCVLLDKCHVSKISWCLIALWYIVSWLSLLITFQHVHGLHRHLLDDCSDEMVWTISLSCFGRCSLRLVLPWRCSAFSAWSSWDGTRITLSTYHHIWACFSSHNNHDS